MSNQAPTPEERLLCKALRCLFAFQAAQRPENAEVADVHLAGFDRLREAVLLEAVASDLPVLRHAMGHGLGHPCATCDAVPT